jgi:hypothetical protein
MSKTVKILGIVVGGVLALVIVGAVAVSLLFDPNDYKDEITAQVKQHTGRTLTLEGNLGLAFFPWLGVESGKATLGNAPGFGDEPFANLDSVDVCAACSRCCRALEARTVVKATPEPRAAAPGRRTGRTCSLSERRRRPRRRKARPGVSIAGLELRDASLSGVMMIRSQLSGRLQNARYGRAQRRPSARSQAAMSIGDCPVTSPT